MAIAANLGFPRLGLKREWKKATESYWAGKIERTELLAVSEDLTSRHWKLQLEAGIQAVPCNDFAFYDHMLDTAAMLGAVPPRYRLSESSEVDDDTYFAMARGRQDEKTDVTAMEMTKWFDTNYHYLVPEFDSRMRFRIASQKPLTSVESARKAGVADPRPVLVGPATFLILGKVVDAKVKKIELLDSMVEVYAEMLRKLSSLGVSWVQIDEPALVLDLNTDQRILFTLAYDRLMHLQPRPKIMLATYFGSLGDNLKLALALHTEGLHVDLVRAPEQLDPLLKNWSAPLNLSLGVVDGRNIWRTDLDRAHEMLRRAADRIGADRIQVAPSCSLLHSPIDLDSESALDPEIKEWMAFGKQKLQEVAILTQALNHGVDSGAERFVASREALERRRISAKVNSPKVQQRLAAVTEEMTQRATPFLQRISRQQKHLNLPLLPTTSIGSFPQTREVRKLRADFKSSKLSDHAYRDALITEMSKTIGFQEEVGLDVLVHGEFERNDMVEYFGEQIEGYLFSENGWVQSYGSRAVKPPVIFGDVNRPRAMTVEWSQLAQKHTQRPMKGMLTGPVTMLQWSFVRDDQPRRVTCDQLALAIRDEVQDLEQAGIKVIQIDEPALREGLPLCRKDWQAYLDWAVRSFRLASSGVKDDTQIHTHMCYSEFNDIIESIAAMDADVISIEASRSRMELLNSFERFVYPNAIGPGVYDIHSPRVPSVEEIRELIQLALKYVPLERLWINPDCGLKTRGWLEVRKALENMVAAAKMVRQEHSPARRTPSSAR